MLVKNHLLLQCCGYSVGTNLINYSNSYDIIEIIISSVVKLSPRFLGKLCFLQGLMSGIDQYTLHYIHPTGIY